MAERIKPPRWLKPMNKVLMAAARTGLPIFGKERPVVLTVLGRKTGKPRSTPITPMEVNGQRYVVGGFPGADWVRNAQANPEAQLTRGGRPNVFGWWSCRSRRPGRCCGSSRRWCRPGWDS